MNEPLLSADASSSIDNIRKSSFGGCRQLYRQHEEEARNLFSADVDDIVENIRK
jgi:hypothetical protein